MCLKDSDVFNKSRRGVILKSYKYDDNVLFLVPNIDKCKMKLGDRYKLVGFCIPVSRFAHIDTCVKDSYIIENLRIVEYGDKISSVVGDDDKFILMVNCINHENPIYRFRTSMISKLGESSYNIDWLFDRIDEVLKSLSI